MSKDNAILVAEFIGTFLLTGAVLMGANPFVALGIIVLLIGGISGAHVNPAVSAAMASVKKLSVERMVQFWIAQILGAIIARLLYGYIKGDASLSYNFTDLDGKLLVVEIVGTAIFLFGITAALLHKLDGLKLAVAIGGSLFLGAMFGGVLNPAVALGNEMVSFYSLIGPVIGGLLGVQIAMVLLNKKLK